MKRLFIGLTLTITLSLFTACTIGPSLTGGTPPANTTQMPSIQNPDGVATTFLDAWQKGDYAGMYTLLSENSQANYTQEEFTEYYTNALEVMRVTTFDIQQQTGFWDGESNGAQYLFNVTYNSVVLGEVSQEIMMLLTKNGDNWAVSWDPGLILQELVGGNTLSLSVEAPARANIYDVNGQWIVRPDTSVARLSITTGPIDEDVESDMLGMLSEMLRLSPERIYNQYGGAAAGQSIALGDVDLEVYQAYQREYNSYPQLSVSTFDTTGRRYYNNGLAAHVVGYTGYVTEEQCPDFEARGFSCNDIVGQMGLEEWGEEYLSGQRGGELSVYTPSGDYYGSIASRSPEPAESIYLTIDRDMQAIVEAALADAYRFSGDTWADTAGGAAVVVVDVNTGAIRAMASYPSFDPNVFHPFNNHPGGSSYINELFSSPLTPLFNRATQGAQPAGSVFKLVTATAALESPQFGPDWSYTSIGSWQATLSGGQTLEKFDWAEDGHGTVNIAGALRVSCNSCFYQIGYLTAEEDLGYLSGWAEMYHFGQEFDLPIAESSGTILGPGDLTSDGRQFGVADAVNMAIGQGDVSVTPLQIAMMTTVVANGGTLYQPQLVDRIALVGEDPSVTFEPIILTEFDVPPEYFAFMREGMRDVVIANDGTAQYRLGSLGISAAGKTGTAQVSSSAQPIAWFTGFVPYDEPEYVITVMVENGGEGSVIASPIFRRIVERWYDLRVLDYPRDWGDPELYQEVEDDIGE